jgi:alkanesulfonate monooxygenase SsuD/methylene tetrahydromethanopterin reductase-like flavin-dependent oxidoreductase (luciferase family)
VRVSVVLAVAGLPLRDSIDLARRAEAAGCDTIAAGEACYDSFAVSVLLAQATARARVMTTVTTWARPPVLTATGALTVAELAPGRFALGLGTMPEAWNREHYGIDPSHSAARMREYVRCVRGAYAATPAAPFSHDGRFFSVRRFARGWPRPPAGPLSIHLAATRPLMARLAGEVADGVLFNVIHTRRWLRDVLGPAVTAGERSRVGRVERGVMVRVVPHAEGDHTRALEQARLAVAPYAGVPYLAHVLAHHGWQPDAATSTALEELAVVGTVEELVPRLLEYRDLVDWLLLAPSRLLPPPEMHDWYDTVLGSVVPAVSSGPAGAPL